VVLAAVVTRVVEGDAAAPALVATVALAPLVALLGAAGPADPVPRARGVADAALALALLLMMAANLVVVAELARGSGLAGWPMIALGPVVALVVIVAPAGDRLWRWALPSGVALVLLALAVVGVARGGPWAAWTTVALRPALIFAPHSAWVTEARPIAGRSTLEFDEVHRVVAGAAVTVRVIERDGGRAAERQWRLAAGEAVTLRPGDELILEAGTPVRFEAGRRIPGAPASGPAWADGRTPPAGAAVAGMAITLVGAAIALVPAAARPLAGTPAMAAAGLVVAGVLGAALWGVYAIALVPEVMLPPRGVVSLADLTRSLAVPATRPALPPVVAAGVLALFIGAVLAWRARLVELARGLALAFGRPAPSRALPTACAVAALLAAAALAARGVDPWRLFVLGAGLATSVVAPRLARAGAAAETGGATVGTVVFIAALAFANDLGPAFAGIADYPALVAAPLAWLAARLARD
jgi:hypothetical protein